MQVYLGLLINEICSKNPPYSFIWHLRVTYKLSKLELNIEVKITKKVFIAVSQKLKVCHPTSMAMTQMLADQEVQPRPGLTVLP